MCTVLLPPGGNQIAVKKYIISYHVMSYIYIIYRIISYHIISYHIISCHVIYIYHISYHIISYLLSFPYVFLLVPSIPTFKVILIIFLFSSCLRFVIYRILPSSPRIKCTKAAGQTCHRSIRAWSALQPLQLIIVSKQRKLVSFTQN
jgi:hypothetical protein